MISCLLLCIFLIPEPAKPDIGFKMIELADGRKKLLKTFGEILVNALPKVLKFLTIVGTLAMLMVAGGIFVHNIHSLHELVQTLPAILADLLAGIVIGLIVLTLEKLFVKVKQSIK